MDWVFVGIMVGSIAYLALIVLAFVGNYREGKAKIEQSQSEMKRLDDLLHESDHARKEAEDRAAKLAVETLRYEQEISELQAKIRAAMPSPGEQSNN